MKSLDRVLIIGGTGLIGSNFLNRNTCIGMHFTSYSRTKLSESEELKIVRTPIFFQENWSNIDLTKYDSVLFLAAEGGQFDSLNNIAKPEFDQEMIRFKFFLEDIKNSDVSTFIFASSAGSLYSEISEGNLSDENSSIAPLTKYGELKYMKEILIDQVLGSSNLKNCVILRISNVYGGYLFERHIKGVIPNFIKSIVMNQPLKLIGKPSNTRDFIHVEDVVKALESILHGEIGFKILNLSSGTGVTVQLILDLIYQIAQDSQYNLSVSPAKFNDYVGVTRSVINNELISSLLNWSPKIDFRNGLETSFKEVEGILNSSE
jgi:nucleoside-diphosphate-sugar epimerase